MYSDKFYAYRAWLYLLDLNLFSAGFVIKLLLFRFWWWSQAKEISRSSLIFRWWVLWSFLIFVQRLRSKPWTYKSKFIFSFFLSFFHSVSNFQGDAARRREASYDVARLLLMAPIDPWRNSTPDFGAVAFCTTNIEDFRTPLTSTSSTISSTYLSQKTS